MKESAFFAALLITSTLGCATYQYSGRLEAENSEGRLVEVLAYWQSTERKLWFDTHAGAVRVKTQCSPRTLVYNEREAGIVQLWEPGIARLDGSVGEGTLCGKVVGARRIADLTDGPLNLTVECEAEVDEFTVSTVSPEFVAAREEAYVFPITREKSDEAPQVAPCPTP